MDNVLKILIETKEDLLNKVKGIEQDIIDWTNFLDTKKKSTESVVENTLNSLIVESDYTKTLIEKVCDIIKSNGKEMFSSQIATHLHKFYKDKEEDWVSRRVSSVLSDDKNVGLVYGRKEREKGQHHLAKVWGVSEFKDENGNVKEEHKYKSLLK